MVAGEIHDHTRMDELSPTIGKAAKEAGVPLQRRAAAKLDRRQLRYVEGEWRKAPTRALKVAAARLALVERRRQRRARMQALSQELLDDRRGGGWGRRRTATAGRM
eukprot:1430553-Pyramimonas_sp.AAC.1